MRTVEITYRYGIQDHAERVRPQDTNAARERLNAGNSAFAALLDNLTDDGGTIRQIVRVNVADLGIAPDRDGTPAQRPFAAMIGCSDARVPVELIFGEGPNDLFVMRVAGNGLGSDVLGSLSYAVDHLADSLRAVVVLGHSGCGALTAAVDAYLQPNTYLPLVTSHALRSVLDRQLIVVNWSARLLMRRHGAAVRDQAGYRQALIETAIVANAALAAHTVQRDLRASGVAGLGALFGVYLLDTRVVWAPRLDGKTGRGLAEPPADQDDFIAIGDALVQSDRIRAILGASG